MKKVTFIYNSRSGKGKGNILEKLVREGESRDFEINFLSFFDFLENKYEEYLKESEAIFAIGGDGTINGVINRLIDLNIDFPPLVIYPGGTSNDFASIWWSKGKCNPAKAFNAIEKRQVSNVDLGKVNEEYFINVVGAGMFVDVAPETSVAQKQKWGFLAYLNEGLKRLPGYHPFNLTVSHNGREEEVNCYLALVLNSTGAGGFNNLIPNASMEDGLLDVLIVKDRNDSISQTQSIDYSILTLFPKIITDTHLKDKRVLHYKLEKFSLKCFDAIKPVIDGETGPRSCRHFDFSVQKRRVPLLYD